MWTVEITNKAKKQIQKLPVSIRLITKSLLSELEEKGPNVNWAHYRKLTNFGQNRDLRHCHLKGGQPTYVACWEVIDKKIKLMEVFYVGTHEKAPY